MSDPHAPDRGRDDVADADDRYADDEPGGAAVVDADRPGAVSETGDDPFPPPRKPIDPESPSPENALFVVLGVLGTTGLLASAILPGLL